MINKKLFLLCLLFFCPQIAGMKALLDCIRLSKEKVDETEVVRAKKAEVLFKRKIERKTEGEILYLRPSAKEKPNA